MSGVGRMRDEDLVLKEMGEAWTSMPNWGYHGWKVRVSVYTGDRSSNSVTSLPFSDSFAPPLTVLLHLEIFNNTKSFQKASPFSR